MACTLPPGWDNSEMERIKNFSNKLPFILAIIIFFVPFFWLQNNQMDLGGDSSRLYFYDPVSYLFNHSLYSISSSGHGVENISYYGIPFISLLIVLKMILNSPTLLINVFHGFTLTISFLSVYKIIESIDVQDKKNRYKKYAGIVAGLLYIFSPTLINGWDKAILTHNQFFINPLFFLILLKFFQTNKIVYIYLAVLLSFIFSPNFSFPAAPPFFAFFPLTILFLFFYSYFILKKLPSFKKIAIGILLFVLIHSFHIIPQIVTLTSSTSAVHSGVFSDEAKFTRGLSYFLAIAPSVKLSNNILFMPQGDIGEPLALLFVIFPAVVILGFIVSRNRLILLTGIFFSITLFFASGKITGVGFLIYKALFSIPGFSMFRNFYGQWVFSFTFYFVLLFGIALITVLPKLKKKIIYPLILILCLLISINAADFINGEKINKTLWQSNNIKLTIEMDPDYQRTLDEIKKLPIDGKVLTLPLTDPGYQLFAGKNGGVYQGPSSISYLTGKKDYAGIQEIQPLGKLLYNAIQNKKYDEVYKIFGLLNIKYIFYNDDPYIYKNFPEFPYENIKQIFPDNKSYRNFLLELGVEEKISISNKYYIYEIPQKQYVPHIYIPEDVIYSNNPLGESLFFDKTSRQSLNINEDIESYLQENLFLEPKNESPLLLLKDNFHLHTHDPFISHGPGTFSYPFVLIKENYDLEKLEKNIEVHINMALFLATKRIYEIASYTMSLNLHETNYLLGNYNSWDWILTNYEERMVKLLEKLKDEKRSANWKVKYAIIVNEQLEKHKSRLNDTINAANLTVNERKYLNTRSSKMFERLSALVRLPIIDSTTQEYVLESSKNQQGPFELYLKKEDFESANGLSIIYKNNTFYPQGIKNGYIYFGMLKEIDKTAKFTLKLPKVNLIEPISSEITTKNEQTFDNSTSFMFNDQVSANLGGVIMNIEKWKPNTQYSITFDYKTGESEFIFKFYEKKKEKNGKVSVNSYFEKILNSSKWKKHQTIITSDTKGVKGYIQILSKGGIKNSGIQIKNIWVQEVIAPAILLVKKQENKISPIPQVEFSKINPTRYKVSIKNAKEPFFLVMSDMYDRSWRVYSRTSKIEYGNRLGQKDAILTDIQDIVSGNDIFRNNHVVANGYANAWLIDPKEMGKEDFDLTITFRIQNFFYIASLISIITATITLILFFLSLLWKKAK